MHPPITVTASQFRDVAEGDVARTTISVDYENNASRWWSAAYLARDGAPASCLPLLLGAEHEDAVTVSDEDAAAFRAWGEKLPGWGDGPVFAREPFTFRDA